MSDATTSTATPFFEVRVLRQEHPSQPSYWERHRVAHEPEMNVISVLQRMASKASTIDGQQVAPVAWDCNCLEEVCGACSMVINGRVRQACTALVDQLLVEQPGEIELRPLQKFPVVRDLVVDRRRMFRALERVEAWVPVDGYHDRGPGDRQSQTQQMGTYPLSECMSCGCCLEACPQYTKIELTRHDGESEEEFQAREAEAHHRGFIGAAAISQAVLFNENPTGRMNAGQRMEALIAEGGIQICGNAQNCLAVCPKEIPLTTSIAKAGRQATLHSLRKWFER